MNEHLFELSNETIERLRSSFATYNYLPSHIREYIISHGQSGSPKEHISSGIMFLSDTLVMGGSGLISGVYSTGSYATMFDVYGYTPYDVYTMGKDLIEANECLGDVNLLLTAIVIALLAGSHDDTQYMNEMHYIGDIILAYLKKSGTRISAIDNNVARYVSSSLYCRGSGKYTGKFAQACLYMTDKAYSNKDDIFTDIYADYGLLRIRETLAEATYNIDDDGLIDAELFSKFNCGEFCTKEYYSSDLNGGRDLLSYECPERNQLDGVSLSNLLYGVCTLDSFESRRDDIISYINYTLNRPHLSLRRKASILRAIEREIDNEPTMLEIMQDLNDNAKEVALQIKLETY